MSRGNTETTEALKKAEALIGMNKTWIIDNIYITIYNV